MHAYRFDADLIAPELDAIQEWCRANDLEPKDIPTNAKVVIDGHQLTVEHYVRNERGSVVIDYDAEEAVRTTRTVPLAVKPELASLKPVDEQGE